MNLGVVRRILREDLSKSGPLPTWIDALLSPLNDFIDKVTTLSRNNTTLQENVSGKIFTTTFTDGVELKVATGSSLKVVGVIPLAFGSQTLTSFAWSRNQDQTINVTFGFATASASDSCTIYIFYGAS